MIFADINYDKAKIAAEESKRLSWNTNYEALALQIDVTNSSAVDHMVEEVSKRFGRIDYLVNSAGVNDIKVLALTGHANNHHTGRHKVL